MYLKTSVGQISSSSSKGSETVGWKGGTNVESFEAVSATIKGETTDVVRVEQVLLETSEIYALPDTALSHIELKRLWHAEPRQGETSCLLLCWGASRCSCPVAIQRVTDNYLRLGAD